MVPIKISCHLSRHNFLLHSNLKNCTVHRGAKWLIFVQWVLNENDSPQICSIWIGWTRMNKRKFDTDMKYTYGRHQINININCRGSLRIIKYQISRTIYALKRCHFVSVSKRRGCAALQSELCSALNKIEIMEDRALNENLEKLCSRIQS